MGIKKLLCTFILFSSLGILAQDVHFSQLSQSPLLINPANAGFFDGYARAILNYRTQWSAADAQYQTIMASFDANAGIKRSRSAFIGLGGYIYQDKAANGTWSTLNANLIGNAVVNVGKVSRLSGAIGAGVGQTSTNFSKLLYGNQYDGTQFNTALPNYESFNARNFTWFDLTSGINFEINKINEDFTHNNRFSLRLGVAGYHLNQPRLIFSTNSTQVIDRRMVYSAQARFDIKESALSILPSVIYMTQGTFQQANFGTFIRYRFKDETKTTGLKSETALHIGCYYRYKDAVIPQFMLEYKSFMFGFSYDQTVSRFRLANRGLGAFEVSISWTNLRNGLFKQRREFNAGKKK